MPLVSIIIRTKNEERWVGHCLSMLFMQEFKDFEVIVVDNDSGDHTVAIARRFPVAKIVTVSDFRPGLAINLGIRESVGQFIVLLSAHCVPKTTSWLSALLANFTGQPHLAGVYGRQLPVSFTSPLDKRDLLTVFGLDRRVQLKDYFFHNANSMIRRSVWDIVPFDEQVTNIEDRVWGKEVISRGYQLVYEPEAAVFHHHGLHQGNDPERAKGVVAIIEKVDTADFNDLPESLKPENANIAAVLLIPKAPRFGSKSADLFQETLRTLSAALYVNRVYVVTHQEELASGTARWLDRRLIANEAELGLDELMAHVLNLIEGTGYYPDNLLYVNHEYLSRPVGLFDQLITEAQYGGFDSIFPGYIDYGHYWFREEDGNFRQSDVSLKARNNRQPGYRALYGLGTVSSASVVRRGGFIGKRVGILPIRKFQQTFRLRDIDDGFSLDSFGSKNVDSTL